MRSPPPPRSRPNCGAACDCGVKAMPNNSATTKADSLLIVSLLFAIHGWISKTMASRFPKVLNSRTSEASMLRNSFLILSILCVSAMMLATQGAQTPAFPPVTDQMLANPSPDDWLMFSRTYDAQRYSPLKQITKENAGQLKLVFSTEMKTGTQESIPIVYRGVIYAATPGSGVQAIDGTNGKLIWEYKRPTGMTKTKGLAIYQDMIYYTAPEGVLV